MITIRTLLGSTKLATKFEGNFQLSKNYNPVTMLTHTRLRADYAADFGAVDVWRQVDYNVAVKGMNR